VLFAAASLRRYATGPDVDVALMAPLPATLDPYLQQRDVRHGMLGVLHGEDRVIGTIMVANRFGLTHSFTEADHALFEPVAANASAALQYDRLEQAVSELGALQDKLQHQALHDPLTGLANRSCSASRCARRSSPAPRVRWP
jgi:GAF domain-containing protein